MLSITDKDIEQIINNALKKVSIFSSETGSGKSTRIVY